MKRLFAVALFAATFLAISCQKETGAVEGGGEQPAAAVPASFDWKMTCDVSATVCMPSVGGRVPDYAVVRIYSSPVLADENIVAMGVVKASQPTFSTAMTLPAGIGNIYVQTTLPDGTASVSMQPVAAAINVPGAVMQGVETPKIRMAGVAPGESSSMPGYPTLPLRSAGDFTQGAVIGQTPASRIDLGASWIAKPYVAAAEYYIPAGAEVAGNLNLSGKFNPHTAPVLYVAGKLTIDASESIGQATIAVLPGGEVYLREVKTTPQSEVVTPAIYVFEGGKFTAGKTNFSGTTVVNDGTFVVDGLFNVNNSCKFYNGPTGELTAGEIEVTYHAKFYNDGTVRSTNIKINVSSELFNCENGKFDIEDVFSLTNNSIAYQKGIARMDRLEAQGGGTLYVNCYTEAREITGEVSEIHIASGAGLDAQTVFFNGQMALFAASGSIFSMNEYNAAKTGGNVRIVSQAAADQPMAVVVIRDKAVSSRWYGTKFEGLVEVVYDNSADANYLIDPSCLIDGAVMREKQTVVIPGSKCNGGKAPVEPDPEPEPGVIEVLGAPYTYCFEDGWPWIGDYDMNDVVVVTTLDRISDKTTGKVGSIRINWELKAAGAAHFNAFAVQLDKVPASQIAHVETTNTAFGKGAFAGSGLEAGNEHAVIPLFNTAQEILGEGTYINTSRGTASVPTVKHTTTVTFARPVDAAAVLESAVNAFIVVNSRSSGLFSRDTEVHMPTYKPTPFAVVSGNTFTQAEPYKYFVSKGTGMKDNYMMWALMIPGEFRYPAERKDIRSAYKYFNAWAASGGVEHVDWYEDETDEDMLY